MGVINFSSTNCKNCYACVRACPVQSIKIKDEQAIIMEERCIACGLCLKACPKSVKKIQTELDKVQQFIATNKTIAVSLAPTCFGVFKTHGNLLVAALKQLGISYVEETVVGAEYITREYQRYQAKWDGMCYITSCCASVNLLIEKHYPKVIPHLIPVMTPLMAHARLLKQKYGSHTKVVFIGPCLAKKIEGENDSCIDAVLTIEELKVWLQNANINWDQLEEIPLDASKQSQRTYPVVGGMSQCFSEHNPEIEIVSVDGIQDCIEVIEGIERGEFSHIFFEMSACHHSCLGGPAIGERGENIFNRKRRIMEYAKKRGEYQRYQAKWDGMCYITSCCASVNLLIEKHYPKVIPHLIPVMTPLMAHARLLKQKYGSHTKVVFIGPCLAKKIEGENDSCIDAVLTIEELKVWLQNANINWDQLEEIPLDASKQSQRTYPVVGGMSQCFSEHNPEIEIVSVDGIQDCIEVIEGIERGEFSHIFFEMSACHHSCLGGPAIGERGENIFNRKRRIMEYAKKRAVSQDKKSQYVCLNISRTFTNQYSPIVIPSEKEIEAILNNIGKYSAMDELNCGSCGYPTCRQKAIAVYNQIAEPTMCLPYMKHKAETYSHVIFDVTPSIIMVIDHDLKIIDFNPAAERFFEVKKDQAIDLPISIFLEESPFLEVRENQTDLLGLRLNLNEGQTSVIESIIWIEQQGVMLCILHDMTSEMMHEQKMQRLKMNAIDMAQQVINKQMIVAQEIASLLGETTAETKVTLTRLKQLIQEDEVRE